MIKAAGAIIVALVLALGWSLWRAESHKGRADRAQEANERTAQQLTDTQATLKTERSRTAGMAEIGDRHEEDRRDAAGVPGAVAAAVQSGDLRLRDELAGCATDRLSGAASAALERDAAAQLRGQIAGAIVQVGVDADDHVNASHTVIWADRE